RHRRHRPRQGAGPGRRPDGHPRGGRPGGPARRVPRGGGGGHRRQGRRGGPAGDAPAGAGGQGARPDGGAGEQRPRRPRVPRGGGRRGQAAPAAHIVPLGTEEDRREEVDVHGEEGPREEDRLVVVRLEGGRGRQRRREVRDAQVGGQEDVGEEDVREEGPGQEDGVAQALGVTGGAGRGGDVGRTEAGCRTGGHGTGGRGEGPTRGRVDVGTGGRVLTGGRGEGA